MTAPSRPSSLTAAAPARDKLPIEGFVLLAFLSVIWGVNWPILKVAFADFPVLSFRAVCLMFGGSALLAIARLAGNPIALPREKLKPMLVVAAFNITAWHCLSGFAIAMIPSGRAAIIGYTMPVWGVLLGALILNERLTWRRLLSLALGAAGLGVLLAADLGNVEGVPVGMLLMAGAALAWAAGTIGIKKVEWGMPTTAVVAWQCLIGGVPIVIAAAIVDHDSWAAPGLWGLLALVYNLIFSFVIGHYLFYKVVRLFPVGIATIGTLAIPIIGLFSGALMLGEPLGAAEFSALGLVVSALAVPVLSQPRSFVPARPRPTLRP